MNLFSGFIAIKYAFVDNKFELASLFVVMGGIFDMLDGVMARLTHSSSEFGVELDSLADVVTFGVAPSAILYKVFFYQFGDPGLLLAALPAILGAVRLARFNTQLVGFDKDYFRGLPIPSSAILIVTYVTFFHLKLPLAERLDDIWMFVVNIGASLMMVSTVKYDVVPKPTKTQIKAHPLKFSIYFVGIVLAIVTKGWAIFPLFALFILYGIVRSLVERIKRLIRHRHAAALLDEEALEHEERSTFGI